MQTITILQTSFEVLKVNSLKVIVCSHSLSSQSILYMCAIICVIQWYLNCSIMHMVVSLRTPSL